MQKDLPLILVHLEAPVHDPARDMVTPDSRLRLDSCFSHTQSLSVSGEFVCPPVVRTARDYHIRAGKMSPVRRHLHNMSVPLSFEIIDIGGIIGLFGRPNPLKDVAIISFSNTPFELALTINKRKNSNIKVSHLTVQHGVNLCLLY
jgi:hypothetical protein